MMNPRKLKILFLCTGNAARSQMAEGWTKHLKGEEFEVYSAGIEAHGLNPYAARAMEEVGIDISDQYSKTVDRYLDAPFDYVVTLCGDARDSCPVFPGDGRHVHVGFEDPAAAEGTDEQIMATFRRVRDEIRELVEGMPESLAARVAD